MVFAQLADEVADLVLAIEPGPGDACGMCDSSVTYWLSLASQLVDGVVRGGEGSFVAPGVGLDEERGVVSAGHRRVCPAGVFKSGDDAFQVVLDTAQVAGKALLAVGVGLGDERAVGFRLPPVDLQEDWCGLEVRAGQAGVWVRAVLLCGPAAVAVGEAVADAVEVVLDPSAEAAGESGS